MISRHRQCYKQPSAIREGGGLPTPHTIKIGDRVCVYSQAHLIPIPATILHVWDARNSPGPLPIEAASNIAELAEREHIDDIDVVLTLIAGTYRFCLLHRRSAPSQECWIDVRGHAFTVERFRPEPVRTVSRPANKEGNQ